jgi:hypothetical protein
MGNIRARAVKITPADTSCAAIRAVATSATDVDGTTFQFSAGSPDHPPTLTQANAAYVLFGNIAIGTYTLIPTLPDTTWVLARACWSSSTGTTGEGFSTALADGATVTYDIGYEYGTAWVQTQGGDVYASGALNSTIPSTARLGRYFSLNGTGGYPGVITFGTTFNFDSTANSTGSNYIGQPDRTLATTNWNVNDSRATVDYYNYFYHRFNSPTTYDYDTPLSPVSKPSSRATPYYVKGDMTTGGWSVGNNPDGTGENIVFLVDGNLTLNGPINITPNTKGFVAFIVSGDITVDSAVGGAVSATAPNLQGIYITSPTGTFRSGLSVAGTPRLVVKGTVVAGNFLLQRDLDAFGANNTDAAELFIYDPQLLLTMPDQMKELPVVWQEVAP